jgi:hypothetical protein
MLYQLSYRPSPFPHHTNYGGVNAISVSAFSDFVASMLRKRAGPPAAITTYCFPSFP